MNRVALFQRRYHLNNQLIGILKRHSSRTRQQEEKDDTVNHQQIDVDFFGINEVTKKDISGTYLHTEESKGELEKYSALLKSRELKDNEQVKTKLSFGAIRFDSDNTPRYHGQYDVTNERLSYDVEEAEKSMYNKIGPIIIQVNEELNTESFVKEEDADIKETKQIKTVNYEDYFPKVTGYQIKQPIGKYLFNHTKEFQEKLEDDELKRETIALNMLEERREKVEKEMHEELEIIKGIKYAAESPLKNFSEINEELMDIKREADKSGRELHELDERLEDEKEEQAKIAEANAQLKLNETTEEPEKPTTALEYVRMLKIKKIEAETEKYKESMTKKYRLPGEDMFDKVDSTGNKLDSKGFRSYQDAVFDLRTLRKSELLWHLKKQIIFCDAGILAINKPSGLICQGTEDKKQYDPVLFDMLPEFGELLLKERILFNEAGSPPLKLHPIHRLDKDVSGVLLFATNAEMSKKLHKLFYDRLVTKQYYAITRNVPTVPEGIIDIPIEEGVVEGKKRMVLRPELEEELRRIAKPSRQAKRAVTHYRILKTHGNAALLEVTPETGVKHQIRVHLGFGLRCPIVGDPKYTYLDRIAPQKLPSDMLIALNVRPSKVRNIPLLLHARVLTLPEVGRNGGPIHLRADLPAHFKDFSRKLKISN